MARQNRSLVTTASADGAKFRKYRANKQRQGLKLVRLWLPDPCRRPSVAGFVDNVWPCAVRQPTRKRSTSLKPSLRKRIGGNEAGRRRCRLAAWRLRQASPCVVIQSDLFDPTDSLLVCLITSELGDRRRPSTDLVSCSFERPARALAGDGREDHRRSEGRCRRIGALKPSEVGRLNALLAMVIGLNG